MPCYCNQGLNAHCPIRSPDPTADVRWLAGCVGWACLTLTAYRFHRARAAALCFGPVALFAMSAGAPPSCSTIVTRRARPPTVALPCAVSFQFSSSRSSNRPPHELGPHTNPYQQPTVYSLLNCEIACISIIVCCSSVACGPSRIWQPRVFFVPCFGGSFRNKRASISLARPHPYSGIVQSTVAMAGCVSSYIT
jgi:hypothetical protein